MKKGLGSIPKSLAWIDNSDELVPTEKHAVALEPMKVERALQETATQKEVAGEQVGRINPQLSCTITPDDKELLNDLALYACNRERKVLNISVIIRALIRLGDKHRDELSF